MSINYYGVLNLSDALFPLLRPNARVVNVASKLGLLTRLPAQSHKDRILNAKAVQDVSQIVEDYVRLKINLFFFYIKFKNECLILRI